MTSRTVGAGAAGRSRTELVGALLAISVLVPAAALFAMVWRSTAADLSFAQKERRGVEYLATLDAMARALTDAQSAAVARQPVSREALVRATEAVNAVDARLGAELRTRDRWAALRGKIEALPNRSFPTSAAAHTAYAESGDLLLVLLAKVRDTSNLIRDPDPEPYYLQDAVGGALARSLVAAANLTDLSITAPARSPGERATLANDVAVARQAMRQPANELTDDLQSAVDRTDRGSISSSLLSRLDRYQRGVDGLIQAVGPANAAPFTVDPARVAKARTELQAAAVELSAAMFGELRALLADRQDEVRGQRRQAIGIGVVALGLALMPSAVALLGWRDRRRERAEARGPEERRGPDAPEIGRPADLRFAGWSPPADEVSAWPERSGAR